MDEVSDGGPSERGGPPSRSPEDAIYIAKLEHEIVRLEREINRIEAFYWSEHA